MGIRDINKIKALSAQAKNSPAQAKASEINKISEVHQISAAKEILLHYPKAVYLSELLSDVASWSDFNIVMDPHLDRKMQIFAPRKMSKEEAFHVFTRSLETVGLRVLHLEGGVVKIVGASLGTIAT